MPTPLLEYWYMALHEPVGIVVISNNRHGLLTKLYAARQESPDKEELMGLSICTSPTSDNELWIVHKKVKVVKEDGEES